MRWCFFLCMQVLMLGSLEAIEEHEKWWEACLETRVSLDTFRNSIGDTDSPSRVAMRAHVSKMGYQSILDVAAGLCIDYFGFKNDHSAILYQGIDITPRLVALAQRQNIPVIEGDIKSLPFSDNAFDICYTRHVLEHLDSYERAIDELVRVASREALIVFFVRPRDFEEINLQTHENHLVYVNIYNKEQIEQFVLSNSKVSGFDWEEVDGREVILHIYTRSEEEQ